MHADLVEFHANTQFLVLAPICPHICEHVWSLLGKSTLIVTEKWPVFGSVDQNSLRELEFITSSIHAFRQQLQSILKPKKGTAPPAPTKGTIYVTDRYPTWQAEVLDLLRNLIVSDSNFPDMRDISSKLDGNESLKRHRKKVMPFVSEVKASYQEGGASALQNESPIEQWQILVNFSEYIRQTLNLESLEMVKIDETSELPEQIVEKCAPARPLINFKS